VGADEIATNAVGTSELATDAVTGANILDGTISSLDIGTNAVGNDELANNAVGSANIIDGSIQGSDIATGAIGTVQIATNTITASDIAANAIGNSELAANAVQSVNIFPGAVTSTGILDGTITSADVANGSLVDIDISDEPGVASTLSGGSVALTTGVATNVLTRTITAPSSGWVLVIGTGEMNFLHFAGTNSNANLGVSATSATFPTNQDVNAVISSAAGSGNYVIPMTVHGLFSVSAGANTFYLVARENTGTASITDMQLSLAFFSTAYGTVTPTLQGPGGDVEASGTAAGAGLTPADVAAEQAEARAFNLARIQRELDGLQQQLDEATR